MSLTRAFSRLAIVIVAVAAFFSVHHQDAGAWSNNITVNAKSSWQPTSISVPKGATVSVLYMSGVWTVDSRSLASVNPNGYTAAADSKIWQGCKVLSSAPYAKLLARVGNGATVAVGSGSFTADTAGTVSLRINDNDSCLSDNSGSVAVVVQAMVSANPYSDSSQCVWYAEQRLYQYTGWFMPNLGNAKDWTANATKAGWNVTSTPMTNSVVVFQPTARVQYWDGKNWISTGVNTTYGHVGWVASTAASTGGTQILVYDRNWNGRGGDGYRWFFVPAGQPVSYVYTNMVVK